MKCLVTGGGGFLGSHIVEALLRSGFAVRIFERRNLLRYRAFGLSEPVEWEEGDFLNAEDVARVVPGCDVIIHLASTTLPKSSNQNPTYDVETNLVSTLGLLDVARVNAVKKVVFMSSGGTVYGIPRSVPINELHPTEPICSYGICKLAIEKYLHLYRVLHELDYCVLRVANAYGERQALSVAQGAVGVFIDKALRNEEVEVWGDGAVVRDYVYAGDIAEACVRAAQRSGEQRVFNVGSGAGKSVNDVLATIEVVLDRPVRRRYLSARRFDVPVNVLDIASAERELGWTPATPFEEGVRKTMDWLASRK